MNKAASRSSWGKLESELAVWRDQGQVPTFWLRDDDATTNCDRLNYLLRTCSSSAVPIALAVIPATTDATLAGALADCPSILVLQHGYAHSNHAPTGEKKSEYGDHRPIEIMLAEITKGRQILEETFGKRIV